MATQIGSLVIDMAADVASLRRDLDQAKAAVNNASTSMVSAVKTIGAAFAGLATVGSFTRVIGETINLADALDELSQKSGFAVEELSRLRAAPDLANIGIEDLSRGLKEFNRSLVEATDATSKSARIFQALGVDISRGPNEALLSFAQAFSRVEDATLRSVVASELFGKQGQAFIPALLGGRKAFEDAAREAERFGTVISTDMARQAGEFNDNLTRLKSSAGALGIAIANPLLPSLNRLADVLLTLRGGGDAARGVLDGMADSISKLLAKLTVFRNGGWAAEAVMNVGRAALGIRGEQMPPGNVATGIIRRPEAPAPDVAALQSALTAPAPAAPRAARGGGSASNDLAREAQRLRDQDIAGWVRYAEAVLDEAEALDRSLADLSQARWDREERERREDERKIIEDIDRREQLMREQGMAGASVTQQQWAEQEQAARRVNDVARDLGLTFSSAFEDAIGGGRGLRDILAGIESDLLRLGTRQLVTRPLLNWLTEKIGGSEGGGLNIGGLFESARGAITSMFSGFFADGGFIPPGRWGITGERGPEAVFGGATGATVVPAAPAPTIVFNVSTPDARSFRASQDQMMSDAMRVMSRASRRNG